MKNDILKNVILQLILLLSLSLVANANAETNDSTQHELQVVETVVLDKDITLYQFALTHQLDINDIVALNPTVKANDVINAGKKLNLPKKITKTTIPNKEEITALPALGHASLASENEEIVQVGAIAVSSIPGSQLVTGTGEENLANAAVFVGNQEWENLNTEQIVDDIKQQAENKAINTIVGGVNQQINTKASDFLGRFGKAQVNISLDKEGKLSSYDVQLLSPLYDESESLIFSQAGVHEQGSGDNARLIGNFGLGYRYESTDWLAGANAFIDHDFTGNNTRLGLGAEYWTDNFKLAANTYSPLSNWKESEVMKSYEQLIYDERPAKGFDVRAQAYLPNYPQLGGSLVFEQYFGDDVDLFGMENRQKDPYSLSVGVDYMPVPLVKTELTHKMGKSGIDDTKLDLSLNLQLGTPLEEQLNPDNVAVARSLKGSRYDMVDRNYDIVFEYQKEDFSLEINGTNEASKGELVTVNAIVSSRSPIISYEWFVKDEFGNDLSNTTGMSAFLGKQNTPNITFDMGIQDLHITVKVTTERGFTAISKVHVVKYKSSNTTSTLTSSFAEVIDFSELDFLSSVDAVSELESLDMKNKAVSIFTAIDSEGKPFNVSEINSTEIKWRIRGEEKFKEIEDNDPVKFFVQPGDDDSKLKIIAIGDISLIPTSGTRAVEIVVISTVNPEISANAVIEFSRKDDKLEELGIDLQNMKIQIIALPNGGNTYSTLEDVVSESGLRNGVAINTTTRDIKPNTKYRAMIKTFKDTGNGVKDWVDVTEYFVKSMVWLYWDPYTSTEVTAINNLAELKLGNELRRYRALEECRSSPIFFTQTNNYVFNELGWGEILDINNSQAEEKRIVTEQGLRLAVQFDFTAINEANPVIKECIPDQKYESETDYAGYVSNTSGDKVIPKAVSWSSAE
ncbi:inverse autotransporter beta domain-containing protein [Thorsellia kenyensis]|uniref:Inverse autotransporter beta domain-containing protein n=1 Tax=Thorsellia kenyensis TaxID=1549888 RepID=A0ABV6C710_9GAMM